MRHMEVRSLSYSTLLHTLSFSSSIENKHEYLVVKTPGNPRYYWGNFLFFHHPPKQESMVEWELIFDKEFLDIPLKHKAFAWDSVGDSAIIVDPFINNGYYLEVDDVLLTSRIRKPNYYNSNLTITPIDSSSQWNQVTQLSMDCFCPNPDMEYAKYVNKLRIDIEKEIREGKGIWMGAFLKDKLVGDMGLFQAGKGRGLVISVKTDPKYRKNGVCRTLLYKTAFYGFEHLGFKEIVMVADQNLSASKIYRSVGFQTCEQGFSLLKIL